MLVLGNKLDIYQEQVIKNNNKSLLVIAGAGSGKTLTILGKIKYLVEVKKIAQEEIIVVTFTNNASNSVRKKLSLENLDRVKSFTFHKLAMDILNNSIEIADNNILFDIVNYFIKVKVLNSNYIMKLILKYFDIHIYFNTKDRYIKFINENNKKIEKLTKTIISFITKLKCNNYKLSDFNFFLLQIKKQINYFKYKKEKILLIIIINAYIEYTYYLKENNELDFDDIIISATDKIKTFYNYKNIKYIIIDEYQDISYIRLLLIKEIINKTDAKIMAVGDDYQSIYGFSGSKVSLFLEFNKYFNDSKIMYLKYTYRNSKELVDAANMFIMKNNKQIEKEILSNKNLSKPIKIIYYKNIIYSLKELLNKMEKENFLILGRNNFDVKFILDSEVKLNNNKIIYEKNKNLNINYMTIHKSKGLEEDNVILINLIDDLYGFPSKLREDKIFRLFNEKELAYYEERRLLYVALTRTKNNVYILAPKNHYSVFVRELEQILKKLQLQQKGK